MLEKQGEKTRKNAVRIVLGALILLLLVSLAARFLSGWAKNADSPDDRMNFLSALGWEVDPESEESREVIIPSCEEGAMVDYNELMKRGGYDLKPFEGKKVQQYSYVITNYPGYTQTVYVTLYTDRGRVIGGDIHSAALNGFMHELRAREPA